jgi:hypothetical protein
LYQGNSYPSDYHLFPSLKQNRRGLELKDGCELGNGYEAVADNAGNGLLSTGNGKVNPTILVTEDGTHLSLSYDLHRAFELTEY